MKDCKISFIVGLAILLSPSMVLASPSLEPAGAVVGFFPQLLLLALGGAGLLLFAFHRPVNLSPNEALGELMRGNGRFVGGASVSPRADKAHIEKLAEDGQNPFVAVLACADSRVPVENIFDMGFGDIFTIRVAGNVIGPDQLGSLEYAVDHLGVPLVLILGHTNCGAIHGAIATAEAKKNSDSQDEKPHVSSLLQKMVPMVEELKENNPHLTEEALHHRCVNKNIWNNIKEMLLASHHLREMVENGQLAIHGAVYNISDGRVYMLGAHREQEAIVKGEIGPSDDRLAVA